MGVQANRESENERLSPVMERDPLKGKRQRHLPGRIFN